MHPRMGNIWPRVLFFAASICLASTASGQNVQDTPANPCTNTKAGQVCDELATLAIRLQKSVYTEHEPVDVELVLQAGKKGVYLPSYFGDFMATCRNGFSTNLSTLGGKLAADSPSGCGGSWLSSSNDTALGQLHNFVHLSPGETRTWHTTLATTTLMPGQYRVIAEYLSFAYMMEEVSRLPQVGGIMAQGRITAPSVIVTIR
jgi:hypothetical protein